MKSKYKIKIKGFEDFRIGEDKELYRLPYFTVDQKKRGIKKISKQKGDYWIVNIDGIIRKVSEKQLLEYLVEDDKPIELKVAL